MLHRLSPFALSLLCAAFAAGCSEDDSEDATSETNNLETGLSFFVTSEPNPTGDLGGIEGADATCDRLATAAGAGSRTWRAYLSAEDDGNGDPINARERIGSGPWRNADGIILAANVDELHSRTGDAELFVDENGDPINGQWSGSPMPVQHDVLTGSNPQGNVAVGFTCEGWTSDAAATLVEMTNAMGNPQMVCQAGCAKVGHTDGMGPMQDTTPPRNSWFSAHDNGGCDNTAPRGGSGRFYCFAAD